MGMYDRITFIGAINRGELTLEGETAKNQILLDYLEISRCKIH